MHDDKPERITIGRYRIEHEIGRGGMSVVYKAHDDALNRTVALKMLASGLSSDDQALARFRREATAVAGLKHQSIALVYDFGEQDSQPYIAFEWVDGPNLREVLQRDGRLELKRAIPLFGQIADALSYAHERGVIHRDIKPANVIITSGPDGATHAECATLVDFGLAWMADVPSLTSTGTIFGTPMYMAPEQIAGKTVDQRTDLYSLAFLLYEMLTGRPPFLEGGTPAILNQHLSEAPTPMSERNPALPVALDALFTRATAKDPAERFQTVRAFRDAVFDAVYPAGAVIPYPAQTLTLPAPGSRLPWRQIGIGAGVLAAAALGIGALASRPAAAPPAARSAPTPVTATPAPSATAQPTATALPAATSTAAPTAPAATLPELRWQSDALNSARNRNVYPEFKPISGDQRWSAVIPESAGDALGVMVDHGRVIAAYKNGDVFGLDAITGGQLWSKSLGKPLQAQPLLCCFYGEGAVILAFEDGEMRALDTKTGEERWRMPPDKSKGAVTNALTIGEDHETVFTTYSGWLVAINSYSGDEYWSVDLSKEEPSQPPALTRAGIYVATNQNAVLALDRNNREVVWRKELPGKPTGAPMVTSDSAVLAVPIEGNRLVGLSVLSGSQLWVQDTDSAISGLAADWGRITVTCYNGLVYTIEHTSGRVVWKLRVASAIDTPPIMDGQLTMITATDGNLRLFETASGLERSDRFLLLPAPALGGVSYSEGWLFVQSGKRVVAYGP